MRQKIYVGCALTHAPQEFRGMVASFKKQLSSETAVEILEFKGLDAGSPLDVYEYDLGNVERCSFLVAFADHDSIGLGMEIQHATHLGKAILCLHRVENKVTRMLIGAHDAGKLVLAAYDTIDDAVALVRKFVCASSVIPSVYATIYERAD